MESIYFYALGSNLCFSLGGQAYTYFSRKVSPEWMNALKATVAGILFLLTAVILGHFKIPSYQSVLALFLSGAMGLGIGDIFLLLGFKHIGTARTMMLFSFQPLVVGFLSYIFLGQTVPTNKLWAILFFMACVFIVSFESFKEKGSWDMFGISMAFLGLVLDAFGIIVTRSVFDQNHDLHPLMSNFYRTVGASLFFLFYSFIKPFNFLHFFSTLTPKEKFLAITSPILGTYISLGLFLMAVQKGTLASISGIAVASTIFSTLFECIIHKKLPGKYFYVALIFFAAGMKILLF